MLLKGSERCNSLEVLVGGGGGGNGAITTERQNVAVWDEMAAMAALSLAARVVVEVEEQSVMLMRLVVRKQGRRCTRNGWVQTVGRGRLDIELGRSC